jgi:hypothetical protein
MENSASPESRNYALLPDELVLKILDAAPATAEKVGSMIDVDDDAVTSGIQRLKEKDLIRKVESGEFSSSVSAVDGGMIVEHMAGLDLLLALAVGVEGLSIDHSAEWGGENNQYYAWQDAVPHDAANSTLCQGIMFLMELSVLANDQHEVRIMDGAHFTSIIKINSMLSANEERSGKAYIESLRSFLKETYNKVIPDIPNIIEQAFNNPNIVALAKYSSSRDLVDAYLNDLDIAVDDKTFFSLGLSADEYTKPMSCGQSQLERERIWDQLHIKCNLDIPEQTELNSALRRAIIPLKTRDQSGKPKESDLFFTLYKPFDGGPVYKIEIKREIAISRTATERVLNSLKKQTVFPELREPYPQFLVDLMAKSVASGMFAMQEAIKLNPKLNAHESAFNLIDHYRT